LNPPDASNVMSTPLSAGVLTAALDAVPNPIFIKDEGGRYIFVNPAFCTLCGRARSEVLGLSVVDLLPADLAAHAHERDGMVRAGGERHEAEETIVDATGALHRVLLTLAPLELGDGRRGVIGTVTDLAARRQIERELRDSREHLARAQRIAAIGSFERNIVTGRGAFSEEALRIVGLTDTRGAEHVPEEVLLLFHEEDRQRIATAVATVLKGQVQPALDARVTRPDGETRIVHLTYGPTRDEDGAIIGFTGSIQDVTELRLLETERRALEQQLHHAQRLEALGTLAGGIAHDLNNTLVPALNLPKLVMKELPENSRGRQNLVLIEEAAKRARHLVRQILDFSRRRVTSKASFRLDEVIRDGLPLLRATLPATIRIEEYLSEAPPMVGDRGQIFQVLLNLAVNAAQAIGDAPGHIEIAVRPAPNEPSVILTVRDNGPGMDQGTLRRIFEPFFTTKPVGGGSGLGLSVVHGIVTAHGGRIAATSAPGAGASFEIHLPSAGPPDEKAECPTPTF
jgi:PAS domain S-box-containing protein